MTLTLTSGDTGAALTGIVNANLAGATARIHIQRPDRTVLDQVATITDPMAGAWSYQWGDHDLDQTGPYTVELEVTYSNGRVQTFPGPAPTFGVREQLA